MQTFKTAVVVVLLLTVMYGAYVSLTTPPPDNLEELEGLITDIEGIEEGDLGLEEGSSASFAISDGEIVDGSVAGGMNPSGSYAMSDAADAAPSPASAGARGRLSDEGDSVHEMHDGREMHGAVASDAAADGSAAKPRSLPKPSSKRPDLQLDPMREYPQTAQAAFDLPDPSSLSTEMSMAEEADRSAAAGQDGSDSPESGVNVSLSSDDENAEPAASSQAADKPQKKSSNVGLTNAMLTADRLVEADQMKEALATLSVFYNSPDLSDEERDELLKRLDPLAGEVIYSRRHLLEQPHRVGQNETLMEIAAKYDTPWQLLANINGIDDPVVVLPGTELKVVRGPFRAEVNLARSELTIFLGESYAGRFPIAVGSDPAPQPGTYTIQDKQTAKTYYDATGAPIPPGDSRNPFGDVWLDLGKQMCIHGSGKDGSTAGKGCISLQPTDAQDIYAILTQGASVTVRR